MARKRSKARTRARIKSRPASKVRAGAKIKRRPTTVYLDPRIARAIKMKAAASGKSVSDFANEGLAALLREDERDLRIFRERKNQPTRDYDEVVREMKRDGLL